MKFLSTFNPFSKLEKNRSRFAFYQLRGQEIEVDSVDLETVLDPHALENIQAEWEAACANYANDRASRNQPILSAKNKAQSPDLEQKFKEEKKAIRVGYLEMVSQTLGLDVLYFLTSDVANQVSTSELREEIRTLQSYFQIQSSADINKFLTELNQKIDTEIEKIVSLKFQQEAAESDQLFWEEEDNTPSEEFQSWLVIKQRVELLFETRAKLREVFVQQAATSAGEDISVPAEATPEMLKSKIEMAEKAFSEMQQRVQTLKQDQKEKKEELIRELEARKQDIEELRPNWMSKNIKLIRSNPREYIPAALFEYMEADQPTTTQISAAAKVLQDPNKPLTFMPDEAWFEQKINESIRCTAEKIVEDEIEAAISSLKEDRTQEMERVNKLYNESIKLARKEISAAYARKQALEVELIQRQDPSWQIEQIREKSLFSESNSEIKPDLLAQIEAEFREEIQTQIAAATADQTPEIQ